MPVLQCPCMCSWRSVCLHNQERSLSARWHRPSNVYDCSFSHTGHLHVVSDSPCMHTSTCRPACPSHVPTAAVMLAPAKLSRPLLKSFWTHRQHSTVIRIAAAPRAIYHASSTPTVREAAIGVGIYKEVWGINVADEAARHRAGTCSVLLLLQDLLVDLSTPHGAGHAAPAQLPAGGKQQQHYTNAAAPQGSGQSEAISTAAAPAAAPAAGSSNGSTSSATSSTHTTPSTSAFLASLRHFPPSVLSTVCPLNFQTSSLQVILQACMASKAAKRAGPKAVLITGPYLPSQLAAVQKTAAALQLSAQLLSSPSALHVLLTPAQTTAAAVAAVAAELAPGVQASSQVTPQQQQQQQQQQQHLQLFGHGDLQPVPEAAIAAAQAAEAALNQQLRLFTPTAWSLAYQQLMKRKASGPPLLVVQQPLLGAAALQAAGQLASKLNLRLQVMLHPGEPLQQQQQQQQQRKQHTHQLPLVQHQSQQQGEEQKEQQQQHSVRRRRRQTRHERAAEAAAAVVEAAAAATAAATAVLQGAAAGAAAAELGSSGAIAAVDGSVGGAAGLSTEELREPGGQQQQQQYTHLAPAAQLDSLNTFLIVVSRTGVTPAEVQAYLAGPAVDHTSPATNIIKTSDHVLPNSSGGGNSSNSSSSSSSGNSSTTAGVAAAAHTSPQLAGAGIERVGVKLYVLLAADAGEVWSSAVSTLAYAYRQAKSRASRGSRTARSKAAAKQRPPKRSADAALVCCTLNGPGLNPEVAQQLWQQHIDGVASAGRVKASRVRVWAWLYHSSSSSGGGSSNDSSTDSGSSADKGFSSTEARRTNLHHGQEQQQQQQVGRRRRKTLTVTGSPSSSSSTTSSQVLGDSREDSLRWPCTILLSLEPLMLPEHHPDFGTLKQQGSTTLPASSLGSVN